MTRHCAPAAPGCRVASLVPVPLASPAAAPRPPTPASVFPCVQTPRSPHFAAHLGWGPPARAPPPQHGGAEAARTLSPASGGQGLSLPGWTCAAQGTRRSQCRHFSRPVSPEESEAPCVVTALAHAARDKHGPAPGPPVSLAAACVAPAPERGARAPAAPRLCVCAQVPATHRLAWTRPPLSPVSRLSPGSWSPSTWGSPRGSLRPLQAAARGLRVLAARRPRASRTPVLGTARPQGAPPVACSARLASLAPGVARALCSSSPR